MPLLYPDSIINASGGFVEGIRGPWSSVSAFFTGIPELYRKPGQEFLVEIPGGYEEYRLVGGVQEINAVPVSQTSTSNVSFWISPSVNTIVDTLPATPADEYRVIHEGIIKQYSSDTDTWTDVYGGTGITLQPAMAVIVNEVTIDSIQYINQLYVYEKTSVDPDPEVFEWVRKDPTAVSPNWDLHYTSFIDSKRVARDATGQVDMRAILNSGLYRINTDISNLPAEVIALDPPEVAFLEVHYINDDNIMYKLSTSTNMYIQVKADGVFGTWNEWRGPSGLDGVNPQLRINSSTNFLQWKLVTDVDWIDLLDMNTLQGASGKEVELRRSGGYVQWKYTTDLTWLNLIPLVDIQGDPGADGADGRNIELNKGTTHIQYRLVGDPFWIDLIAISELVGPAGPQGPQGTPGSDGAEVVQAEFVGDDIVFTKDDTTTFTIVGGRLAIKGDDGEIPSFRLEERLLQYKFAADVSWTTLADLTNYLSKQSNTELEGTGLRILRINDVGGVEAVETIEYSNILPYPNLEVTEDFILNSTLNGATILVNSTNPVMCTIPLGLLTSPNLSFSCNVVQMNTGVLTVNAQPGVSLLSPRSDTQARTRYSILTIIKLSNDVFLLGGDIA